MKLFQMLIALIFPFALLTNGCERVDVKPVEEPMTAPAELPPVMRGILVARERIDEGTELTDDLVKVVEMPKKYVTDDMLLPASRGDIIGRVAAHAVPSGAILHERDFAGSKAEASDSASREPIVRSAEDSPQREVPGKARAALIARGNEAFLGVLTIEPGAGVPQHRDPTEEFLYVLEGGGTITIDGTSHDLRPEMGVYMPADAEVSFQNGDVRTRVVQIFAGPGPASKYDDWQEPAEEAEE